VGTWKQRLRERIKIRTLKSEGCGTPQSQNQLLRFRDLLATRHPQSQKLLLRLRDLLATRHFWQRRFYDFNVWSEKKLREKLQYMHANPVQRKLVQHPRDWPWSSWGFYCGGEAGLIGIDVEG
jgi:hypothetical protein